MIKLATPIILEHLVQVAADSVTLDGDLRWPTDRYDDEKLYPVVTNYDGVVIFDGNPKQEPEHPNPWSVPCRLDFRELEKNRLPVPEDPRAGFGTHQKWR